MAQLRRIVLALSVASACAHASPGARVDPAERRPTVRERRAFEAAMADVREPAPGLPQTVGIDRLEAYVDAFPTSPLAGVALFNAASIAAREDCSRAMQLTGRLIASNVRDDEASGDLMSPFRNYRYRATLLQWQCEMQAKRPERALALALAAERLYVTHCGTCAQAMSEGVRRRSVESLLALDPRIDPEALGALLAEHAQPRAFVESSLALTSDERAKDAIRNALGAAPRSAG